ncbi:MAG: hypothetical protein E6Q97_02085 [Desulfurellales bacterium]|nr:MAG: hypothetical protein E6Q97_02085 [Desulfurellales bacterium]
MRKLVLGILIGFLVAASAALSGCGFKYHFKKHGIADPSTLTAEERDDVDREYKQDRSACLERGYALQTYSGSWGVSEGSGGGSSSSRFNQSVFIACMEARGWDYEGKSPTTFGIAWY